MKMTPRPKSPTADDVCVCLPARTRVCCFIIMQGEQALKPRSGSGSGVPSAGSACLRCHTEAGADRRQSKGGGKNSDGASDVAVVQHHHTCGRTSPQLDVPASLNPHGPGAKLSSGKQQRRGASSGELGQELVVGDLATPLTSAGAGDVGAENDATPLQSRPSRGGFTLSSVPGGDAGGGGTEDASGENPVSGMDSSGEGGGGLKRKDTITWESFLATMTVDGTKGADGGAKGTAVGSASGSSSPVEVQLPREGSSERRVTEVSLVSELHSGAREILLYR